VWAWGSGAGCSLGDGTTSGRSAPGAVAGLPPIAALATQPFGSHCLAVARNGTLWAWGKNGSGSLGDGTTTDRLTPVQVQGLSGIVAAAVTTWGTSYALDDQGRVWSWGSALAGQLGDGSTANRSLPGLVPGLEDVVEIAAGDTHAIVRTAAGQVLTWGINMGGQLGVGDTETRWTPTPVTGLTGVLRVFAGTDVSGAIAACELGCSADAPASAEPMEVVQFAAAATMTSGCTTAPAFDWDFGDGTAHSSEQIADHWYDEEGTFHWVLTVIADGQSCTREGDITITHPCTVSCSATVPTYVQAGTPAAFVGAATPNHCATAASLDWDFGDGSAHASDPNPSHIYAAPGIYSWTLTVTSDGASCVRTGQITVLGPACTGAYNLIIPAAAHSNNAWQSDLDLYNVGAVPASVDIALLKPGQANLSPAAMNVAVLPGQTLRIPDILGAMLPAANAALGIRFCSGAALVNSRFYNIGTPKTGTFGAIVPALPPSAAITPTTRGVFHHLTYSPDPRAGYRVNLGFANASPFSVSVTVRLYGDDSALIGTKTLSVRAYEQSRLDKIHQTLATGPVTHGAMTVEVNTPPGALLHAYALLIDNLSGDPAFMAAELVPR
jgi:PKD repeat protein